MKLVDELHAIAAALRSAGVRYAVCGGMAVNAHGAPRTTKDIDIVVAPEDFERVLEAVGPLGYKDRAEPRVFDAGTKRERVEHRVSKTDGPDCVTLDILLANAVLARALDDRLEMQLPQGPVTVVSRATLIRMKHISGRVQDLIDLSNLEREPS